MNALLPETPSLADTNLIYISKLLGCEKPVRVPIKLEPYSQEIQCAKNVYEKVKRDGGQVAIGWSLVYFRNYMYQAQFHAVWRSPEGKFIDITPAPAVDVGNSPLRADSLDQVASIFAWDKSHVFKPDDKKKQIRTFPYRWKLLWPQVRDWYIEVDKLVSAGKMDETKPIALKIQGLLDEQ